MSNLRGQDLTGQDFANAAMDASDLRETHGDPTVPFTSASVRAGRFEGADISGMSFANANLRGAILQHVTGIASANFAGATLVGARFENTDLDGADLSGAILPVLHLGVSRWPVWCDRLGRIRVGCHTKHYDDWVLLTDEELLALFNVETKAETLLTTYKAQALAASRALRGITS